MANEGKKANEYPKIPMDSSVLPLGIKDGALYQIEDAVVRNQVVGVDKLGAPLGVATLDAEGNLAQGIDESLLVKVSDIGTTVAGLDSEGKVPNSNIKFGNVAEGDSNVVSGGEVDKVISNKQNLFLDPYFKEAINYNTAFSNVFSLRSLFNFKLNNFDSKYRKSFSYVGTENATLRLRFKISDLGLLVGDTFSASILINATGDSRARFHVLQLLENGNYIGEPKYSNYIFGKTDYELAKMTDSVRDNCFFIEIWLEKYGGSSEVFWTGLSFNKGNSVYNYKIPNTYIEAKQNSESSEDTEYRENKFPNNILEASKKSDVTSLQSISAIVSISDEYKLRDGLQNFKMSKTGTTASSSIIINNANKWTYDVPTTVILPFYIPKMKDGLTQIVLNIRSNNGSSTWSRSTAFNETTQRFTHPSFNTGKMKEGWNLFRWDTSTSLVTNFGIDLTSFKIDVYCGEPIDIYFAGVFFEYTEKAKMMFVNDHGRSGGWLHLVDGQTQNAVKDCEGLGMKVTFALNPLRHEQGESLRYNMTELEQLKLSNIAYFSFHSYAATATQNTNYIDMQNDAKKSIYWLQSKGFGSPKWRACFTQNLAVNGLSNFHFMGLNSIATWKENTGRFNAFPLIERNNIKRFEIHGRTNAYIDSYFEDLKKFRGVTVPYTHAIIADNDTSSDAPFSCKLSTWKYFIDKCTQAKNEGWLEFVSYDDLIKELEDYKIQDNDESIIDRYFSIF